MKVLGIDPGIERVGWGLIETNGNAVKYIGCGCIKTSSDLAQQERLASIAHQIRNLVREKTPDRAVVERLFFAKNKKTALSVSESRGAILVVLLEENVITSEYTPLEVKRAITGNGSAEKRQVAWMVKNILKIKENIASDDALDALALCLMAGK